MRAALNALMQWIDRIDDSPNTPTLADFLKLHPDPDFERLLDTLQTDALQGLKNAPLTELAAALRRARRTPDDPSISVRLPRLNPS